MAHLRAVDTITHPLSVPTVADIFIGGSFASTPLWLQGVEVAVQAIVIFLGLALISVRLAIAIRAWRRGDKD